MSTEALFDLSPVVFGAPDRSASREGRAADPPRQLRAGSGKPIALATSWRVPRALGLARSGSSAELLAATLRLDVRRHDRVSGSAADIARSSALPRSGDK